MIKKKKMLIWWIDDEKDGRLNPTAKALIETPRDATLTKRTAELQIKRVTTDEGIQEVAALLSKQETHLPDLIVIDQMLNVLSPSGLVQRGSSVAVLLRAQVPSIPVVGVSGSDPAKVAALQKDQFIELFSREAVHKGHGVTDFYAIADGFRTVIDTVPHLKDSTLHRSALLKLIDAAPDDEELLFSCIPGEFKKPWDDETPHSFARWMWHTFLGRPGFVFDDLEVATFLGVKLEGITKLQKHLSGCEYAGAFASGARRRWWLSKVRTKIRKLRDATAATPLWMLGRDIVKDKELFSRSYGSSTKGTVPDVVAFQDGRYDTRKRVQTRIEDTEPVETDTPPIGFEQLRVYRRN